jgi:small subunit ribosomal protein S2
MEGELEKLEANLGGVADMKRLPDAIFVVDLKKEQLAIREARRLGLPILALVDTNCDPDDADYVIPGNDDAIRSCSLIVRVIADGIEAGRGRVTVEEMTSNGAANGQAAAAAPESPADEPVVNEEEIAEQADAALGEQPGADAIANEAAEAEAEAPAPADGKAPDA